MSELPVSCILWQKNWKHLKHPLHHAAQMLARYCIHIFGQCHASRGSPGENTSWSHVLEEFAVVGFIRLIISHIFAIVGSRIVGHLCDVMATAGDQKTMPVITWWQNQWFSSFLCIHRNSRKQELDIYHLNIQHPAIIYSTRPVHLRLYPPELLCGSRCFAVLFKSAYSCTVFHFTKNNRHSTVSTCRQNVRVWQGGIWMHIQVKLLHLVKSICVVLPEEGTYHRLIFHATWRTNIWQHCNDVGYLHSHLSSKSCLLHIAIHAHCRSLSDRSFFLAREHILS